MWLAHVAHWGMGVSAPSRNPTPGLPRATSGIPCPTPIGGLTLLVCLAPLQVLPFAGLLPLPSLPALLLELGGMLLLCPGSRFHP